MKKTKMASIAKKNAVVSNIIDALDTRSCFLMVGHETPDEDCIASLVSFALLVTKFEKDAYICLRSDIHEHYDYLLKICRHNSIHVTDGCEEHTPQVDTIVVCDTPKPEMMEYGEAVKNLLEDDKVVKIEIDHHLEADSGYAGQPGYCLVDEASSASELVGLIALKLCHRHDLIEKYNITDLLSRNLVLAILTGIIGDSKMGKYLKTRKEERFYRIFSSMFNDLLVNNTVRSSNFSNQDEVFDEIGRLSSTEALCHSAFMDRRDSTNHIGHVIFDRRRSASLHKNFVYDTVVSVSRSVADELAEGSGYMSFVAFFDPESESDLVQFRMRRSQAFTAYDLRKLLDVFQIPNGGGHEGAIGFRVPSSRIEDFPAFSDNLLEKAESAIAPFIK